MDKNYWSRFYARHKLGANPSLFAKFVWEHYLKEMCSVLSLRDSRNDKTSDCAEVPLDNFVGFQARNCEIEQVVHRAVECAESSESATQRVARRQPKQKWTIAQLRLIELGCGNGRDSIYFAKNGIHTLGIDQCENVIDSLNKKHRMANLIFQSGDFTALPNAPKAYDAIYSRFTLHSINATQQSNLFKWIGANLKASGILAIECRGYKNSLYRLGVMVEEDAFIYENHYRRFVKFESLLESLSDDYEILFAKEDKGFAPFKDEDDYFVRIVAISRGGGEHPLKYFIIFAIKLDSRGESYAA